MTAVDRYVKAKAEYDAAVAFNAMFTQPGNKVVNTVFYCTQKPASGSPVQMPQGLRDASEKDARKKADNICAAALLVMEAELAVIAEEARAEYAALAQAAGIPGIP
jgi:hypothetical protein